MISIVISFEIYEAQLLASIGFSPYSEELPRNQSEA